MLERRPFAGDALLWATLLVGSLTESALATEGELRWRIRESGDHLVLAVAETDGGTDDLGNLYFSCTRAVGRINVISHLGDDERVAVADVIRAGKYPTIELGGDTDKSAVLAVQHSDMDGWQISFDVAATGRAFDRFAAQGLFEFKVGQANVRADFKVGLDQVAKFQNACRKAPVQPAPLRKKQKGTL
jgi:hypothetical protein